ncbi:MAG: DUF2828 family protein [Methanogenium sp.]
MSYFKDLEAQATNVSITENGAIGLKTTNNPILDLNFMVSSLRSLNDEELDKLSKQYIERIYTEKSGDPVADEQKKYFLKWLFYLRDVRGGLGERRSFRKFINNMSYMIKSDYSLSAIKLIPEYGRWDDLILLINNIHLQSIVSNILLEQINNDIKSEHPSLLAKWMPSTNASSKNSRELALKLCKMWGFKEKLYRKTMSSLRKKIGIIETMMSKNNWKEIDYEKVPSKANLIYKDAFLRNDEQRRSQYLEQVASGEKKINTSANFPHEIVNKYSLHEIDTTLEIMWKSLPKVDIEKPFIVVADGSGSMLSCIGNTNVTALAVANSLAIYFSERLTGEFKDKYITFSTRPKFVDLSQEKTLKDKIAKARTFNEISDTNIERVFDLLLSVATKNGYKQEEIPNVLIISDMEFNDATDMNNYNTLFEVINNKWKIAGYSMPKLVFWNVNSRTNTIPMKENENGVILVSGFSQNVIKTVMSGKMDPWEALKEILDSDRYKNVPSLDFNLKIIEC